MVGGRSLVDFIKAHVGWLATELAEGRRGRPAGVLRAFLERRPVPRRPF